MTQGFGLVYQANTPARLNSLIFLFLDQQVAHFFSLMVCLAFRLILLDIPDTQIYLPDSAHKHTAIKDGDRLSKASSDNDGNLAWSGSSKSRLK
jgi:hypothetical protein